MADDLSTIRHRFRDRFLGGTLPFLIDRGWDWKRDGLIERVDAEGADTGTPFRRVMVHARQLYVFSAWGARTGDADLTAHADRIFAYMTGHFWDHEAGGWIEKVGLDGAVSGTDKDLYAHAFALFGLGRYCRALDRRDAAVWIDRTAEVLERHFRRPDGSYSDRMDRNFADLAAGRRSQNPHMHLLEAALSLAEMDPVFADLARRLIALFKQSFLEAQRDAVLEHLDGTFAPHPVDGNRVEPGHHFEWAWMLDWASRALGDPGYRELAPPILGRGLTLGWDGTKGAVFDEVDLGTGSILLSTKRIWPLLELIKALLVLPNPSRAVDPAGALGLLLERYLGEDGRWTERYNADWTPADRTMPSSTAYHLSMTLEELERIVA